MQGSDRGVTLALTFREFKASSDFVVTSLNRIPYRPSDTSSEKYRTCLAPAGVQGPQRRARHRFQAF
jgi:hypothetical protein